MLVGLSRKSMLGRILGRPAAERVHGSVALAVMAVLKGARIVRAHDVAATVDALKTVTAMQTRRMMTWHDDISVPMAFAAASASTR